MFLRLSALLVASSLTMAAADQVPTFNVKPTCGGAVSTTEAGGRTSDQCIKSELEARDHLARQWANFPAADRSRCVQLATMTSLPSYVEVLTCLEMARDARQLSEPHARSTVGQGH